MWCQILRKDQYGRIVSPGEYRRTRKILNGQPLFSSFSGRGAIYTSIYPAKSSTTAGDAEDRDGRSLRVWWC